MSTATSFVVYFTTADEEQGYVTLCGNGIAEGVSIGGTPLAPGVYRMDDGELHLVQGGAAEPVLQTIAIAQQVT